MKEETKEIPSQAPVPWSVAFAVSWAGLRRRLMRSMITMLGIVLAIAFLTYMIVVDDSVKALVAANEDALNLLLQKAGVDIFAAGKRDTMMLLLIGLSLLTCLVGIVNSMLMSVTERIREIGTMKCLGALDSFIVKTYFIESSLQGVIGTIVGIVIGLAVAMSVLFATYGGYMFTYFPGRAVVNAMGIAFISGAVISVAASIAPAYWAARKEPVNAMRVEE
jgi:putative ABC transport system permease protein